MSTKAPAHELALDHITVRFGGLTALDDVSLRVPAGRIVGVIGPNGAGKTTLFNVICGFVTPTSGRLTLGGRPWRPRPHHLNRLGIARTLQGVGQFGGLTVLENVQVGMRGRPSDQPEGGMSARANDGHVRSGNTTNDPANDGHEPSGNTTNDPANDGHEPSGNTTNDPRNNRHEPASNTTNDPGNDGPGPANGMNRPRSGAPDPLGGGPGSSPSGPNPRAGDPTGARSTADRRADGSDGRARSTADGSDGRARSTADRRADGSDGRARSTGRGWWAGRERWSEREALAALRRCGVAQYANELPGALPYAIRKRIELARALAARPRILMLDEPAGGLDAEEIWWLAELITTVGTTVLLVEHHMDLVMSVCDEILVLDFGKPVALGSPAEISANEKVTEAYLGAAA